MNEIDLAKCEIEIIPTGRNKVEKRWVSFSKGGEKLIARTEYYGQSTIDKEVATANAGKTALDALVVADEKTKYDAKLAELGLIQAEMDK